MSEAVYTPSPWGQMYHALPHEEALGAGAAGPGKALCIETPIWTAQGWKRLGDVQVHDVVFSEDGAPCNVVARSQVWEGHRCFEVLFDDGNSIIADAAHEWLTLDYNERSSLRRGEKRASRRTGLNDQRAKRRRPQVRTTEQIAASVLHRGRMNHAVMVAAPVQGMRAGALVELDPYALGVWLGDGTRSYGQITSADPDIPKRVESAGFRVAHKGRYRWAVYGLRRWLTRLGLSPAKFIPQLYKQAPVETRMALLQGLVDTDGHVDVDGRVEVTLCDRLLSSDVLELVQGLGFKATIRESDAKLNGKVVGRRWRIAWSPMGRPCAWLKRKAEKLGTGARTQRWRYIVACREVPSVPTQCIRVDSPSHLFLAGRGFIPTHNSMVLLMDPIHQVMVEHERCTNPKHEHPLVPGMSRGWAIHLRRTMPMLEQTIARSERIFPLIDPSARFNQQNHTWTFASGYRYQFGHCKDPGDWQQYFSNEYTWIGFDELVQFEEEQYDQIAGRLRSSDAVLSRMLKVRSMSNPVLSRNQMENIALADPLWVRKRFVDPAPEGKVTLTKKITLGSGEVIERRRIYLPATLYDNPDPVFVRTYEANLRDKPIHMQKALLFGDWYFTAGSYYTDWDKNLHVCKPFNIPKDWLRFRSMDWGYKAPGCVHWWAMDDDGNIFCERELTFQGKTATEVAERIKAVELDLKLWKGGRSTITGPSDTQLWEERGETAMTKAEEMLRVGVAWTRANKSRVRNANLLTGRLKDHDNKTTTPGIVFFDTCKMAIKTIPGIIAEQADPELPVDGGDDHWHDSVLYACGFASRGRAGVPSPKRDNDSPEPDDEPRGRYGYGDTV